MATDKKSKPRGGAESKAGLRPLPPARPPDKQLTIEKSWRPKRTDPAFSKKK